MYPNMMGSGDLVGEGWIVFENPEECWNFVRGRRQYTAVKRVMLKKSDEGKAVNVYAVKPFEEECRLQELFPDKRIHHYDLEGAGKMVIRLMRDKMSFQKLVEEYHLPWIADILEEARREREAIISRMYNAFQNHPITRWVESVRGLGETDAVIFICMIDPHLATTSGKACAFWGLAGPKSVRRRGEKAVGSRVLRGVAYFMASRVVMKKDPYYYPLFSAKKEWYLKKCQERGEKGYRAHADTMAKLWLAHLLVSHAWEKYRAFEGLPIHPHRLYIPPKPSESAAWNDESVLERLRTGRLE
jgi:hypothetical protein